MKTITINKNENIIDISEASVVNGIIVYNKTSNIFNGIVVKNIFDTYYINHYNGTTSIGFNSLRKLVNHYKNLYIFKQL